MILVQRSLGWCGLLALLFVPVSATPVLIGEFALQGTLNNNVSGGPALALLPFAGVSGQITSTGYNFLADQGLTFTSSALNTGTYSIELSFKSNLDSTRAWSKLVDVSNLTSDDGLYIHNVATNDFRLQFYPQADGNQADFTAGVNFDVVLTRNSSGTVAGYVNGQLRFSFPDTTNQALITAANTLSFFVDEPITQQAEASGGTVNYIRIFNDALSASEVAALLPPSAIPEPSTFSAILGVGALGFALRRTRRPGR